MEFDELEVGTICYGAHGSEYEVVDRDQESKLVLVQHTGGARLSSWKAPWQLDPEPTHRSGDDAQVGGM